MNKKKLSQILLATSGMIMLSFFQNCSGTGFELADQASTSTVDLGSGAGSGSSGSGTSTPVDHPNGLAVAPSTQAPLLANRYQIQSLLMDTFKDPSIADSSGNNRVLSKILVATIVNKTGTFGIPCDSGNPLLDVTAGGDCDGTIVAPMNQPATTLRAAFKIQACEQILSNDVFVNNLLKKIGSTTAPVNAANVTTLWNYFYRGDDADQSGVAGLVASDQVAMQANASIKLIDRWRLLMTVVCESSGWEAL